MTMRWMRRGALALVAVGAIVGALLGSAKPALADYGKGAIYQVEISANCVGPTTCVPGKVNGFGIWLWAELNPDGAGDYEAADCGHGFGDSSAFHDSGAVAWSSNGSTLTITGAAIFGDAVPMTITVPAQYGHYDKPLVNVITVAGFPPLPGWAQVQIAP
jgi:hypothetical protein